MEIYELTRRGESLAHNIYAPSKAVWRVLFYLSKRHQATKEQILNSVPEATWHTLYKLRRLKLITLVGKEVAL